MNLKKHKWLAHSKVKKKELKSIQSQPIVPPDKELLRREKFEDMRCTVCGIYARKAPFSFSHGNPRSEGGR